MPDPSLLTLFSALGGAALGATGAVVGPMLLHRRQARERRDQEARLERREQEQALREEEWRRREIQLELDRDGQRDREARTRRLITMRATTRDYQEFLARTYQTLVDGHEIDHVDFKNGLDDVHKALNSAFDEALLDGLWFAHARQSLFLGARSVLKATTSTPHGIDASVLSDGLSEAAHLISGCVTAGPPVPDDTRAHIERALLKAHLAREALVAYVKGVSLASGRDA